MSPARAITSRPPTLAALACSQATLASPYRSAAASSCSSGASSGSDSPAPIVACEA
jgi:hypothetical protein